MKCIFCLEDRVGSEEHIFPEAIGGAFVTDRVCKPCNDKLGAGADSDLTNHPFCIMARDQLRIPDRDGNIPSFVEKCLGQGVLADNPSQRTRLVINPDTGALDVRLLYQENSTSPKPGVEHRHIILDSTDAHRLPTIIQRQRKRAGFPPLSEAELQETVARLTAKTHELAQPTVKHNIQMDTVKFMRGLAKIAYEYAWWCLGDTYLDDAVAQQLRPYVLNGREISLNGQAQLGASEVFQPWASESNLHLAFATADAEGRVGVAIRIFSSFSAKYVLSKVAHYYPDLAKSGGAFVANDPISKTLRHSTFEAEIGRLSRLGSTL